MARDKLIQLRRSTASNWTSVNPVLAAGEGGLETDTGRMKYGDGSTAWSSLSYFVSTIVGITGTLAQFNTACTDADFASLAGTETLTNKRITKRVLSLSANSGTPTYNTDTYDVIHITAQTAAINLTTNKTGTPVDGDTLRISITGTAAVAITMGTGFEASTVALPTTTVTTARLDIGCIWNTETTLWRVVSVA